jgi:DNA-binding beta-propeller fold protein YncE
MRGWGLAMTVLAAVSAGPVAAAGLELEAKIPLGTVSGRIDHLAIDPVRGRLFVAELGNDSVSVVDLAERRVVKRLAGLDEPQGLALVGDTLYVANAGDGSVRLYQGDDFAPVGRLALGDDADNIRVDTAASRVYVGHGGGALAVIDPVQRRKIAEIRLAAHPESFQLDAAGSRAFVNVPDAGHIAVVDLGSQKQVAAWRVPDARSNFPMAFDAETRQVLVAFRHPAKLVALDAVSGRVTASLDLCGDSDDLFLDARRHLAYASCGEGAVDVVDRSSGGLARMARVPTTSGARTSLFVPSLDRLFVAVRASGNQPAAVWVFRPVP